MRRIESIIANFSLFSAKINRKGGLKSRFRGEKGRENGFLRSENVENGGLARFLIVCLLFFF
jgi:hypothetical protein